MNEWGGGLRDAFAPLQGALVGLRAAWPLAWRRSTIGEPTREELVEEVGRLQHEVRRLQALETENRILRTQLGFQAAAPHRLIAAEVIARDLNTWWYTLRIGKGAVDGVRPDMPVLVPEGLVGKTITVSGYTSEVRLLVDPDSSVSACLQRLEAFGIVRGGGVSRRGDGFCRMTFLVKDLAIQPGEEVVTSGLSAIYPRGLLIGRVSRTYVDRSGLYQTAEVIPAADLNALRIVYVMDRVSAVGVGFGTGR